MLLTIMLAVLISQSPMPEDKVQELRDELRVVQARLERAQHGTTIRVNAARAAELEQELTVLQSAGDLAALEGSWKPTFAKRGDLETSEHDLERRKMTIRNSRYSAWVPRTPDFNLVEIRLDATKSPKHLDLVVVEGPNIGQTQLGIYELQGDELKVCYGFKSRPTLFEARIDDWNAFVVTYRRLKP
jgi:uncharacterized protein (TIGR03067 family)